MKHRKNKQGQTLAEYAMVIAFISVVAIGALFAMGGQVKTAFSTIDSQLASSTSSSGTPTTPTSPGPRGW